MTNQKFDDALLNAVDFAFDSLGSSCKQALYFHLETTFHVERTEIPEKVEEFNNALRLIFKDGAVFLERLILEKLCEGLGVNFDEKDVCSFVEAVSKLRGPLEAETLSTVLGLYENATVDKRRRGGEKVESES